MKVTLLLDSDGDLWVKKEGRESFFMAQEPMAFSEGTMPETRACIQRQYGIDGEVEVEL